MKITCNSCGSKYTIADAKVQGKKVKVRCKGCKESILVDGTTIGSDGSTDSADDDDNDNGDGAVLSPGADESMASATDDESKKDLWSVNISDDDSRDMTLEELIAGWKNGTVTSDAYVWKDGMGDWKPILEVGELKLKLGALAKAPAAKAPLPHTPAKKGGVVSSASAAAAAGGADDLFGGVDLAANHPSEIEKPIPAAAAGKATGARNDSSVLFSLDSLNAGGGPAAPQTSNRTADALFAGLDTGIGSLTGNADLLTAPAKEPPKAPAGNRSQPVASTPSGKSKAGLIAAVIGAVVIIGGAMAFMGGGDDAGAETAKDETAEAEKSEADKKAEKELAEKTAKLAAMEAELKKAKEEAEKKEDSPDDAAKKQEEELKKEKEEAEKKEAEEAAKKDGATATAASTSTAAKTDSGSKAAAPSGGAKFDVGAARAALQAAASNAAACKTAGGPTGSGKVQVTFSTSGRVTSATVVSGPFGGTSVGGCVASTFRRARVPAFSGDPQTVAKSFNIN